MASSAWCTSSPVLLGDQSLSPSHCFVAGPLTFNGSPQVVCSRRWSAPLRCQARFQYRHSCCLPDAWNMGKPRVGVMIFSRRTSPHGVWRGSSSPPQEVCRAPIGDILHCFSVCFFVRGLVDSVIVQFSCEWSRHPWIFDTRSSFNSAGRFAHMSDL